MAGTLLHEVGHSLGGSRLLVLALLPAGCLQLLLKHHHAQHFVAGNVLGASLHHHSAVAPFCATVGRTHAIDNNLFRPCGGRDDKASRTHAETVNASAVDLRHHIVFRCGQISATSLRIVIHNLVDKVGGMLKPNTYGYSLGFHLYAG